MPPVGGPSWLDGAVRILGPPWTSFTRVVRRSRHALVLSARGTRHRVHPAVGGCPRGRVPGFGAGSSEVGNLSPRVCRFSGARLRLSGLWHPYATPLRMVNL